MVLSGKGGGTVNIYFYILTMAVVTYLIRMLPLTLFRKKIKNQFILSFLYYVPYTCLTAMTVPAIFSATSTPVTAGIGFLAAVILGWFKKNLITVAATSCVVVFMAEMICKSF